MNKLTSMLFAATLSVGSYSALAATASPDPASNLGNEDTKQQMDQSDAAASKTTTHHPMRHKSMKHHKMMHHDANPSTDSMSSGSSSVPSDNKLQPNPDAPSAPAQQ